MKLMWFKTTEEDNGDTEWEFGCAWLFFLGLAAVVTAAVFFLRWVF